MSNGKSKTQACVLIDGTTSVLAAHSTNGGKTCNSKAVEGKMDEITKTQT